MGKKYVLAKDTPMAKKGSEIEIYKDSMIFANEKLENEIRSHCLNRLNEKVEDALFRLLREGWIEEVKPLGIWVNEYKVVCGFDDKYGQAKESKKDALEDILSSNYIRTVHFIEAPEGETK